ncbi:MAG: hypothetical protein KI790_05750, partial [Cyclobacteriaceae bacterium]|nr:hypothetical protein [Cyclobacteriaceae bacterium HetDA_MAG_MS6]
MIRLKAGVLSFTMYIAIIIAIILLAIILLGYYSRLETAEYRIRLRLLDNLQSGVEWTLAAGESVPYFGVKEIDLYGELSDSVRVKRYPWGLFDLYYVQSFRGDRVFQNVLTTGQRRSEEAYASLYLIDEGRPLSLVGDAYLGGDVYLPLAGIQSAYINRVGYTNEKLTQGLRKRSEKEMPELQQEGLDLFFRSYSMFPQFEQVEAEGASVFQAFEQEQLHLIEQGAIEVTDTIQGMVFLDASSTITFDSLSYTQHVVARAEQIIFKSGFTGQGQFFAEDTIIVESGAKLLYPS